MPTVFHVSPSGSDRADGSSERPLRTIGRAAALAQPSDTVLVHTGEYREWVRPPRGGLSDARRITYAAAPGERVVVKGSERVLGWTPYEGTVWTVAVANTVFGDFNPFAETVGGDWIVYPPESPRRHLGDVYLNGRSFYEAAGVEEVIGARVRTDVVDDWTGATVGVHDPDQTRYAWYAEVGDEATTI